jgi:hypothetical protein
MGADIDESDDIEDREDKELDRLNDLIADIASAGAVGEAIVDVVLDEVDFTPHYQKYAAAMKIAEEFIRLATSLRDTLKSMKQGV